MGSIHSRMLSVLCDVLFAMVVLSDAFVAMYVYTVYVRLVCSVLYASGSKPYHAPCPSPTCT